MKIESVPELIKLVNEMKALRLHIETNRHSEQMAKQRCSELSAETFELGRKCQGLQTQIMDLVFETKDGSFL